jgi:PST family polysaccharide transporter
VHPVDWLQPLSSHGGLRREGLRALALVGAGQLLKLTINVAGTLILVRLLSPEAFGLAAMTSLLMNLVLLFKDFGLGTATVQSTHLSQRQASTLFWLAQLGGVGFCLAGLAAAPLLAWFFAEPELCSALMVLSAGFLLSTLGSQHAALLSRNLRFANLGGIEIVAVCAGLGAALLLASLGYGWWSLVWQRMVQLAVTAIGVWVACSWRPSWQFSIKELRSQLNLSLHVTGASMAGYVSRNADNLLIGWHWGAAALGLYSKAYDLLMAPLSQIATPLGQALQPILGRLRDDPQRYRILLTHAVTGSLLILLPVGTLMAGQSVGVTRVLLGEPWMSAAPVVGWFGFLVCFHLCGSVLTWSLISRHRGGDLSRTTLVNAILNLVGFAVSVPYGIAAVAATYTLLGAFVRTPYFLYVCSGDAFFSRAAALHALWVPTLVFVVLSTFYAMSEQSAVLIGLPGWQSLLLQLVAGYVLLTLLVLPTSFGRFVLRRGRLDKA